MDNPEEVMQILERFNVSRSAEISDQLEEYITFVARTGDSVYPWSLVKNLFREKLVHVITEFYNETPTKELPQYPNVDPFNYETMKKVLVEKLDSFSAAPFTIQRISELLSDPRKQYSRIDKFMRAVEKTILVVSTVPPGRHRSESENGDSLDSALNGDFASEVNVDIDMEQDGAFTVTKDTAAVTHRKEQNHDVTTVNHEIITIKKTVEEGAGPSDKVETEAVKVGAEVTTDVTIETVSITVIEPDGTTKESEAVAVDIPVVVSAETTVEVPIVATSVSEIAESVTSAGDEILVDTSEIISETTPLAALENIVAIRTEPTIEAPVEIAEETPKVKEPEVTPVLVEEEKPAQPDTVDDSGIETKRQKLEDQDTPPIEIVLQSVETPVEEPPVVEALAKIEDQPPSEPSPEVTEEQKLSIEEAPIEQQLPVTETQPEVIESSAPEPQPVEEEKIDEPLPAPVETPIEIVPVVEVEDIAEAQPSETMETVPTITENTMSLDDDEPLGVVEQEMTPIASKMDTDEVEAAPMDFEDDAEPMDQ